MYTATPASFNEQTTAEKPSKSIPLTARLKGRKNGQELKEQQWVRNFHMMCSKDNERYPKMLRELFEKPFSYDINMTRRYFSSPGASSIPMAGNPPRTPTNPAKSLASIDMRSSALPPSANLKTRTW
jgi:hypothetical protein